MVPWPSGLRGAAVNSFSRRNILGLASALLASHSAVGQGSALIPCVTANPAFGQEPKTPELGSKHVTNT